MTVGSSAHLLLRKAVTCVVSFSLCTTTAMRLCVSVTEEVERCMVCKCGVGPYSQESAAGLLKPKHHLKMPEWRGKEGNT